MPRYADALHSDARWYYDVADDVATLGLARAVEQPQPSVSGSSFAQRPPGHPLLLAAAFRVAGESVRLRYYAALSLLSLLAAGSTILIARAGAASGLSPATSAYVALVFALAPTTVWLPRTQMSEPTATFFLLAYIVAVLAVSSRPSPSTLLAAGVLGALCLHTRLDLGPIILAFPVAQAVHLSWRRKGRGFRVDRLYWLGLVVVVSLLLCIPWSAWLSLRLGHVVAVADGPTPTGFSNFQTTLALRPDVIQKGYSDFEYGRVAKALRDIPDAAWGSDRRHLAEVARIADAAAGPVRLADEATRDALRRIAAERIATSPLRHYVWLPLFRAGVMWTSYHQAQTEQERLLDFTGPRTTVRTLWNIPYALLVLLGALRALSLVVRPAHALFPVASVVVVRTVTLVGLSTIAGDSFVLPRYLVPVDGIALLLAVSWLVAAQRRNRDNLPAV